jgi:hypothetical protein
MDKNEHNNESSLSVDATQQPSDSDSSNIDDKQDRAGDFARAGKFAPGGYSNQQGNAKPDRVDVDEELAPRRQLGNRQ